MKSKLTFNFLIAVSLFTVPLFAFAALVPCGGTGQPECSLSCFYVLIHNVINFLLYGISIPLAVTALMVAGIMFLFGGSEKTISRGKAILSAALIGLFFAFGAWLIIDLILKGLLKSDSGYLPWNDFPSGACQMTQPNIFSTNTSSSGSPNTSNGLVSGNAVAIFNIDEGGYEDGIKTNTSEYQTYKAENDAHPEGYGLSPATGNANCNSALDNSLLGANLNGVDINRVKAIIQAESSGNPDAANKDADGKYSYGLMQVRADTARIYDSSLAGKSDAEVGDKLVSDPQYNINIGTKYYSDLLKKYNGDATLAHTAYNGGPLANKPSVNCPGLKRWQCEWDNNEHTVPNTGYNPTRKYISNISNYMNSCQ